jgi:uncharacterized membrane protein YgaE (UPF0421/DUF939 family)
MLRRRMGRLRQMALSIVQCAIGAGLAWLLATEVLRHSRPFFAPMAVIICIGAGLGQPRLRRVVELVVGVSVGVGVGDLLVAGIGAGAWQLALVVALAMAVAVLLDGGPLITVQGATSAVLVVTLLPPSGVGGIERMVDALVGGLVGLAAVALLPGNPSGVVRAHAVRMIGELAAALTAAADAIDQDDPALATQTLRRLRSQQFLDDYRDAVRTAWEISAVSPLHHRRRRQLRSYMDATEPLDHALRNLRVLLRRTRSALLDGESIPPALPSALRQLAAATRLLADDLGQDHQPVATRSALQQTAATIDTDTLAHTGFSAQVVAAQLRSVVVDLLQATGLRHDQARATLPTIGDLHLDDDPDQP